MNERQQEYFRGLLLAWKKSILSESESTLAHLQDGPLREPDLARPYLARAAARHHVVLVTLDGPRRLLEVVTKEGDVIDTFSVPAD